MRRTWRIALVLTLLGVTAAALGWGRYGPALRKAGADAETAIPQNAAPAALSAPTGRKQAALSPSPAQTEDAAAEPAETAMPDAAPPQAAETREPETQQTETQLAALAPQAETPAAQPGPAAAPVIGVLRVAPDGETLLAGRAAPGETIDITIDDQKIGEAQADRSGEFIAYLSVPASEQPQRLGVSGRDDRGAEAEAMILPAPRAAADAAATLPAPVVVTQDPQGHVAFVQRPALSDDAPVTLDALSYDEFGGLTLQGRARANHTVRIYAGPELVAEAQTGPDGGWRIDAATAPEKDGALRLDEIDPQGRVATRSEVPYRRPASTPRPLEPGEVVVQPGATLWALAQDLYGDGARYAVIFEANRDHIRDPDLIYPGQIFALPGEPEG